MLCLEHISSAPMWPTNQLLFVKINYSYYFLFNRALNQLLKYYENFSKIESSFFYNLKKWEKINEHSAAKKIFPPGFDGQKKKRAAKC